MYLVVVGLMLSAGSVISGLVDVVEKYSNPPVFHTSIFQICFWMSCNNRIQVSNFNQCNDKDHCHCDIPILAWLKHEHSHPLLFVNFRSAPWAVQGSFLFKHCALVIVSRLRSLHTIPACAAISWHRSPWRGEPSTERLSTHTFWVWLQGFLQLSIYWHERRSTPNQLHISNLCLLDWR